MDPFCSGSDLTLGVPCDNNVPVCNHGQTDVPAGMKVFVYPANSPHFPICAPPNDGSMEGECTLTVPIPAGQCVTLNEADCNVADMFSGTHTLMVNPPAASGNSAPVAECHCENNWSDYHAGTCDTTVISGYGPQVYMQIYEAVCDPGQAVQWGYLTWNSLTPGGSNILFQAHAADTVGNLALPITTLETAKATPAPDTQACSLGGPSPDCPVNLFTELGLPEANLPVLELIITLNPSPQGLATPTLNDWEITYSCIDSE